MSIKSFLVLFFKKELLSFVRPSTAARCWARIIVKAVDAPPGTVKSATAKAGLSAMPGGAVILYQPPERLTDRQQERTSFLKKRSKRLLSIGPRVAATRTYYNQKFFGSFFQKRTAFLLCRLHPGRPWGLNHRQSRLVLRIGLPVLILLAAIPPIAFAADPEAGHVTGLGGIFVKSKDPKALAAWYRDILGIQMAPWGGAALRYDAPMHPPVVTWTALPLASKYTNPSTREFMLDFGVDDMNAIIARLTAHGVKILKRDDSDPSGSFAWIMDSDGTKIELWQAKNTLEHGGRGG